ncbi:hypothetical protein G3N95_26510 [Paraburkholderia sp. Tr-20389]|uniref:hypothetical protein n=1 Tax=Paraburkholderia sp. Tr-20389 TaxID=2703903 RepID=UPI0019817CD9|nr:hypothetical protein [Paraburkholderia sp. Tr-20389]MBN3756515.1 hypothetical protein [Paraburkholderia sp. Tr-20389]
MKRLDEKVVGAIFLALSGYSFASDLVTESYEEMTVANVAPLVVESLPSIPEPQQFLRDQIEFRTSEEKSFYVQSEIFYSAQITHGIHIGADKNISMSESTASRQAAPFLHSGPSTAPQFSILQPANTTLALGTQPQRRLSLTVDDWVFSATARVAILHSHNTGMTFSVRHGY